MASDNIDHELIAAGKCGRPTRGEEALGPHCTQWAGWGTDHAGVGACKLHGGCNPIKHGRFSEVAREKLGERFDRYRSDPEIGSVENEVAILRGLAEKQIEAEKADETIADMVERVVRSVDTLQRHRQKFGITIDVLTRVCEQMGVVVAREINALPAEQKDPGLLARIEEGWKAIQLDPK